MKKYIIYSIILLCIVAFSGCRKDLCYTHPHNGSLEIEVDYTLLPAGYKKHSGITVTFSKLPEQTSKFTYNFLPDGGTKSIAKGNYRILMTNNDYERINIRNAEDWDMMEAYSSNITHKAHSSAPKNLPSLTKSPSRSGIAEVDLFIVSSEHNNTEIRSLNEGEVQTIVLKPQSLTIPIVVRVPINEGIQYISQARGFLSGVSPSVKVVSGARSQSPADLLYEYSSVLGKKELRASFSIFGLVDRDITNNSYKLGVELLLIDESVIYYEFEISNQITNMMRIDGGEIVVTGIEPIERVERPSTGGGFKPSIDNWDEEEIPISAT